MAEPVVRLPDPSPEDAEDVVWGISTAKSLWARGERQDAIVWVRRAAEAARTAGQSFRATELGMYASELDDALEALMASTGSSPAATQSSASSASSATGESGVPGDTATSVAPAPSEAAAGPRIAIAPLPAPPLPPSVSGRPPSVSPPPSASSVAVRIPLPPTATPSSRPGSDSSATPNSARIPAPPSVPSPVSSPMSRPTAQTPVSTRPPAPVPAPSTPPPPLAPAPSPALPLKSKSARLPAQILDPWAEDAPTSGATPQADVTTAATETVGRADPTRAPDTMVVVEMRARPPSPQNEEDDGNVMTSAAPLEETLRRRPPPPRGAPPPLPNVPSRATPPSAGADSAGPVSAGTPRAAISGSTPPPPSVGRAAQTVAVPPAPVPLITFTATSARESFAGLSLEDIGALSDLPNDVRDLLTEVARVEELGKDEEVAGFGAALVIRGHASVCATIVDTPAHSARVATLIPTRGSLAEGTAIRVVAGQGGAHVAVWNQAVLDMALKSCPWVLDDLRATADRLQALAGATMGPLGDHEETVRNQVTERLQVHVVQPFEVIAEQGGKLPWLAVVGSGYLELLKGEPAHVTGDVRPGDFLFPGVVVRDVPAPTTVRAGASGAVLLVGDPTFAREILTGSPPLIGILGE